MRTGLPSQTQTPAIAIATRARQVRAWRIEDPSNVVNGCRPAYRAPPPLPRRPALSKGCGYAGQRNPVEANVLRIEIQVTRRRLGCRQIYQGIDRRISVPIRLQTGARDSEPVSKKATRRGLCGFLSSWVGFLPRFAARRL